MSTLPYPKHVLIVSVTNCSHVISMYFCLFMPAFFFALTGGSAVKYLSEHLPKLETDWSKWRVFFCDERHVPYDDPECTFTTYKTNLFSHIPIPDDCIFPDNPSVSGWLGFCMMCNALVIYLVVFVITSSKTVLE